MPFISHNPLPIRQIGDPFVLRAPDGLYYCYATSDPQGFKAWSSADLQKWTDLGLVYRRPADAWGEADFWAPEVVLHKGRYLMHYSARWGENHSLRIGVAISAKPSGPFVDVFNRPLFDAGYAAIDGHVLRDDDGHCYLYYSRDCSENIVAGRHESHLYVVELTPDLLSLKGSPVWVAAPEQAWELRSGDEWRWNEGPFVLKHAGRYVLMYSANCYASRDYGVGVALAESPFGPFIKAEYNPVLTSPSPEISGPGHNSVTLSPDGEDLLIVYHVHTDPLHPDGDRQVCIDRMGFRENGDLFVAGPTLL
ncbi:MAG TPA: glycoside hydrolase family 43 protein [Anaerolineaceae bacterium]|nr:glycoside hydrolase family 43 protein [Anaerolineaceae bacterium]HPN54178.1 glycoside hydrolase family 43 protein [Anaerolineaceae bacterium]